MLLQPSVCLRVWERWIPMGSSSANHMWKPQVGQDATVVLPKRRLKDWMGFVAMLMNMVWLFVVATISYVVIQCYSEIPVLQCFAYHLMSARSESVCLLLSTVLH